MKFYFKIIKIIRLISYLPFRVLIFLGNLYSSLLKILDRKNHDTFWQEIMQKNIDKNISRDIQIEKDPKKIIKFFCPTKISSFRAKTFFTKEPETINWMDKHGSNKKCLYDLGANVGIYSIYYAKKFESDVYAFEPSFKNLDLFSRNVKLNDLEKYINLIPNPISSKLIFSDFFLLNPSAGEALATFNDDDVKQFILKKKKNYEKSKIINYRTLGISVDYLIAKNIIKPPSLIKIDVDGNELDIVDGLKETISKVDNLSILIETRVSTHQLVEKKLKNLGLHKFNQFNDNSIWQK